MTKLSIVLPSWNEARNIPLTLESYAKVWPADLDAELLIVDNGSSDDTAQVLQAELPKYPFARSVRVEQNRGYGYGIMQGLRAARGEVLAFSHADMQCPAQDVFAAYALFTRQSERERCVIKGTRQFRGLQPTLLTTGMTVFASALLGRVLRDINAQPKLFHRSHLAYLTAPPDGFELDLYVLYRMLQRGGRIVTTDVVFGRRAHGESKWAFSLFSRYRHIAKMMRYIVELRSASERTR